MSKRLTNNKVSGFTLIELLAVIVILAIIATIATPIVLSIIEDTRESATLRSAEYYLDAVETSIATAILKNTNINDGPYKLKDGNICLDSGCIQKLEVEIKGETPDTGTIYIEEGQISDVTLFLDNKVITKSEDNELVYTELEYETGQEVTFNPGDEDRKWNVIDEDATTVTLILTENLGETIAWCSTDDNSYGPKDALNYLNTLIKDWTNVNSIENYTYINNLNGAKLYGYQKIEIKNGIAKLTHKDGKQITDVAGVSKARVLTLEEVLEIGSKTNTNLTEENLRAFIERNLSTVNEGLGISLTTVDEAIAFSIQLEPWLESESRYMKTYYTVWGLIYRYKIETTYDILLPNYLYQNLYSNQAPSGYWTLSTDDDTYRNTWIVECSGEVGDYGSAYEYYGVRPVITIPKSKL